MWNKLRIALLFFAVVSPCARAELALLTSPFETKIEQALASRTPFIRAREAFLGGIVPHHDIALPMIAKFYDRLASEKVRRIWLFSPDHFHQARKFAAVGDKDWSTAGGILKADREICERLASLSFVEIDGNLFAKEHGVTLHIPLIARHFPGAVVIPIVLNSNIPDMGLVLLKNAILKRLSGDDLIILSMDLSHYKTPEEMAVEDEKTLDVLTNLRFLQTRSIDVDTRRSAFLTLRLFQELGARRGVIIDHMDSSDILGRRIESGTSYATILYSREGS